MEIEHTEHSTSAGSVTEKFAAWIRGRWQLMLAPTPPYTGSASSGETPAQQTKSKR